MYLIFPRILPLVLSFIGKKKTTSSCLFYWKVPNQTDQRSEICFFSLTVRVNIVRSACFFFMCILLSNIWNLHFVISFYESELSLNMFIFCSYRDRLSFRMCYSDSVTLHFQTVKHSCTDFLCDIICTLTCKLML